MPSTRSIGTAGTTIRLIVGLLLIAVAFVFDYPNHGIGWWDAGAVLVVFPLIAIGAAAVLNAAYRRSPGLAGRARRPWSATQSAAAAVVIAVVLALGTLLTFLTPVDRIALWLFLGLSMVVAAIRGYDGCEILAIPNTVLRRTDAIWCPLYTPIDTAEQSAAQPIASGGE